MAEHPDYLVSTGHNVDIISMNVILQQPRVDLVRPVRRHYGLGGQHYDEGLYAVFEFDVVESPELYQAILAQFGLDATHSYGRVTIYARDERMVWSKYNGYARMPEPGSDNEWGPAFLSKIRIYVTDLVKLVVI